jgi:mono/diheme cytochrome c family protein
MTRSRYTAIAFLLLGSLAALSTAIGQRKPDPGKGNEIFDEQCSSCHNATSADRKMGPGLKLLFAKPKLDSNGKPVNDANVLDKIEKGGNGMPPFKDSLEKDDKADLLAYLKTL